ncbi:MAG: hypothetical protein RJB66_105 [Pseudomonadota bacterium]|jgi:hypothetical protein
MRGASIFNDPSLAFCLLLSTFLLLPDIPSWAFASALIFWFYRLVIDRAEWKAPSRWVTGFFSILFMGINYFFFRSLTGKDSSSSFLVILLGLKVLEYQNSKEKGFLILLGLYLITSKFLFDIDLFWFSLGFPAMIVLVYHLLTHPFRERFPRKAGLYTAQSLLLAAPLAAFLFFYFPRFSNEMFITESNDKREGVIGFSEDVAPGSVSALATSEDVAFRAEFVNLKPNTTALYWRGLALTQAQNLKWKRNSSLDPKDIVFSMISSNEPSLRITLEPSESSWLFTLEHTDALVADTDSVSMNSEGAFRYNTPITKRIIYRIKPTLSLQRPRRNSESEIHFTQSTSPQVIQLVGELRKNSSSPESLEKNITDFFADHRFQYTLSPMDGGELSLADFLFKTQKGFCEHFASAAALLLNESGVPARVVVGYLGGDYNPIGNFWTIRQKHAHAWVEYVDSTNQWHRYDPTNAVNPFKPLVASNRLEPKESSSNAWNILGFNLHSFKGGAGQSLLFFIENLNYRWSHFILNFDIDKQKQLLAELGINIGLAVLLGMLGTLILSLSLSWLFRTRQKLSRSQKIYSLINNSLYPIHLGNQFAEAPEEWKQRIIRERPLLKPLIDALFDCYYQEAFANNQAENNWRRAQQLVRKLK